jgi:hypothetical protein
MTSYYKGFDSNLKCRDHQFEIGKTYKVEGEIKACNWGFHSCPDNPLAVLGYVNLIGDDGKIARFADVEISGATDTDGSKIASAEITIKAELTLPAFIKKAVEWLTKDVGDSSQLAASGHYSKLAASGHYSQLAASGHYSKLAASGDSSQLAASGDSSKLAASGHYSQLAASGDSSQLAASGDSSQLAASGHYSKLAASGDSSQLAASGENSVIAAAAPGCIWQGGNGTHVALPWFVDGKCQGFVTGCVGVDGLKPNTPYRAENGKFVEVAQ